MYPTDVSNRCIKKITIKVVIFITIVFQLSIPFLSVMSNLENIHTQIISLVRKPLSLQIATFLKYLAVFLLCVVITLFMYIRVKYQFWNAQPVFHIYDIYYYLFPPGVIRYELPDKNKFCNFVNIQTIPYSSASELQIDTLISFTRKHYLANKENTFSPTRENIAPYFTGHHCESFITIYTEPKLLMDTKTNTTIESANTVSVMTSRPIHVSINNGDKDAYFTAYYVDYLCVDSSFRKKGIAPQMIQTHEYNQRHANKKVVVSLFKREGELTGIVPLCVYSSYGYDFSKSSHTFINNTTSLPSSLNVVKVEVKSMYLLIDFMKSRQSMFDIVCVSETSNLVELVKTQNMYCYVVIENHVVLHAYFFRKTCTFMEKGVEVLSCIASIKGVDRKSMLINTNTNTNTNTNNNDLSIFVSGYKTAITKIQSLYPAFTYMVIENVSDNHILVKEINRGCEPDIVHPTAYFFYNFAYRSFSPQKVLIIN